MRDDYPIHELSEEGEPLSELQGLREEDDQASKTWLAKALEQGHIVLDVEGNAVKCWVVQRQG